MSSKYVDTVSIMQIIGCVYNNLELLDSTDRYNIIEEDFPDEFHKIIYGSIYKLYELGAKNVSLESISDFLSSRPKSKAIYESQKGEEWLIKVSENADLATFNYHYNRLKKFTLLRVYDDFGIDVSDIYDPDNILDMRKKQAQEEYIDNSTLEDLAIKIETRIDEIRSKYVDNESDESVQASVGIYDLIEKFKNNPEVGVPLYGPLINTVTRGARLKKFYLRSAASGTGKTRSMIADACYIACNKIYDKNLGWISTGLGQPTLFITTEQEVEEIQTMMLAFLSNVNEEHILNGSYEEGEEERVLTAANILEKAPLYIEELPDFSLKDVEDKIKRNLRERDIKYVFRPQRAMRLCNTLPIYHRGLLLVVS